MWLQPHKCTYRRLEETLRIWELHDDKMTEFVFLTIFLKIFRQLSWIPRACYHICMQHKPRFIPSTGFGWSTQWMNKRIMERKSKWSIFFFFCLFRQNDSTQKSHARQFSWQRGNLMWHSVLAISREMELELLEYKAESLCLLKYFAQEWNLSLYD